MMYNSHAKNFVRRELRTAFESFSNGFRKFRNWKIEEVFRIFCYIVKFNPPKVCVYFKRISHCNFVPDAN